MPSHRNIRCVTENAGVVSEQEDACGGQQLREECIGPEGAISVSPGLARMVRTPFGVESMDEHDTIDL